jgi:hypothetical protein
MTDSDPHPSLVERMKRHHELAARHRGNREIEAAIDTAGFDLGTDIGHPVLPEHTAVGYVLDADLSVGHEALSEEIGLADRGGRESGPPPGRGES